MQEINLLLDSSMDVDIPRDFAEELRLDLFKGICDEDVATIEDPENRCYWEAWELEYHGDLWLLCSELVTNEEKENFGFEIEDEDED